ncbi:MAG: M64 family metallopeptidase [Nanoarchaeota archaeon]
MQRICICAGSAADLPEGYIKEEANGLVTIYNLDQLKLVFGIPTTANESFEFTNPEDGVLRIFFEGKPLGILYGTIVADVEHKKLIITDGGFISPRTEINEQASSGQGAVMTFDESTGEEQSIETRMVGKKVEIDASKLPALVLTTTSGRYAQHKYSFVCSGKCRLTSLVMPRIAYLNVSGSAMIIKTTALKEYQDGKAISRKWHENISGLNEIGVLEGEGIGDNMALSVSAMPNANFGEIIFQTSGKVVISRSVVSGSYSDSITPKNAMRISMPGSINAMLGKPETGTIELTLKRAASAVSSSLDIFGAGADDVKFSINKGNIFLTGDEENYLSCSGEPVNCIFGKRGLLKINPGDEIGMSVAYPASGAISPLEMLELGEFESIAGKIDVKREGVNAVIAFSYNDIKVANGNWFDLGISFSAYVYDAVVSAFNNFRCDVTLRECYLDGQKVVGFSQQQPGSCLGDWDCGTGKKCINPSQEITATTFNVTITGRNIAGGRCVTNPTCYEMRQLNPSPKPNPAQAIDVLLIPDGYGNREDFLADATRVVDRQGLHGGLLGISPFSDYKNKFVFYTMPLTQSLPSMQAGSALAPHVIYASRTGRLCPNIDRIIVVSKNQFRSSAMLGESAVVSVPASGSMTVAAHEFGHIFGMLADEYNQIGGNGHPYIPNCLASEDEARRVWNSVLGPGSERQVETMISLAKTYPEDKLKKGCGGDCGEACIGYFRPSFNSIMNHDALPTDADWIPGGESFNPVSKKWLINKLNEYS